MSKINKHVLAISFIALAVCSMTAVGEVFLRKMIPETSPAPKWEPGPAVAAAEQQRPSVQGLWNVLMNDQDTDPRTLKNAKNALREGVLDDPEILDENWAPVIAKHPDLIDKKTLNRLFHYLEANSKMRACLQAVVVIAVNTENPELMEAVVSNVIKLFDYEYATWWAGRIISKIAKQKPDVITPVLIDKLFDVLKDKDSGHIASFALSDIVVHKKDDVIKNDLLPRIFRYLDMEEAWVRAAYIIYRGQRSSKRYRLEGHVCDEKKRYCRIGSQYHRRFCFTLVSIPGQSQNRSTLSSSSI